MVKRRWTTAAAVAALVLVAAGGGFAAQNSAVLVATAGTANPSDADLEPQVADLAVQIAKAVADAEAKAKADGLDEAQTQAAIQAAVQTVIAASGQSPRVVASALAAVKGCTTGAPARAGLIGIACPDGVGKSLSGPALAALDATEQTVLALLDSNARPASLGDDEPGGGLETPPSGGLASGGGSDYLP